MPRKSNWEGDFPAPLNADVDYPQCAVTLQFCSLSEVVKVIDYLKEQGVKVNGDDEGMREVFSAAN